VRLAGLSARGWCSASITRLRAPSQVTARPGPERSPRRDVYVYTVWHAHTEAALAAGWRRTSGGAYCGPPPDVSEYSSFWGGRLDWLDRLRIEPFDRLRIERFDRLRIEPRVKRHAVTSHVELQTSSVPGPCACRQPSRVGGAAPANGAQDNHPRQTRRRHDTSHMQAHSYSPLSLQAVACKHHITSRHTCAPRLTCSRRRVSDGRPARGAPPSQDAARPDGPPAEATSAAAHPCDATGAAAPHAADAAAVGWLVGWLVAVG
jgi:hypothetical protein